MEPAVLAVECAVGAVWWAICLVGRRHAPDVDDWRDLLTRRMPRAVTSGALPVVAVGRALP